MHLFKKIENILEEVQTPQRYIGNEIGMIRKKDPDVRVAFGFPDTYELGMNNLAMKIFYNEFSKDRSISFERTFLPFKDMMEIMSKNSIPLFTLESFSPVSELDIFAITLPAELSYLNALKMIELAGIPLLRKNRGKKPLLIAGGPAVSNPVPLFPFFDIIFCGEGDHLFKRIIDIYKKEKGDLFYEKLRNIDGVIIPKFYEIIEKDGLKVPMGKAVDIAKNNGFHLESPIDEVLIPISSITESRHEIEIMRGCNRGCRFCLAGNLYRPKRERDINKILSVIKKSIEKRGCSYINLLSLSTGDYSQINDLIKEILKIDESVKVSLPSLRIDSLDDDMINELGKRKITSLTFALESGSERLRRMMNKKITDEMLFNTLKKIKNKSWNTVKFYFMMGLPGESDEDIEKTVTLIEKINAFLEYKFSINVTFSVYCAKPNTPFEDHPLMDIEDYLRRVEIIKRLKKRRNIKIKYGDHISAMFENTFSRGDISVSDMLLEMRTLDITFSNFNDPENREKLLKLIEKYDLERYTKKFHYAFWRDIVSVIDEKYLISEKKKALSEKQTNDCNDKCNACRICGRSLKNTFSPALKKRAGGKINKKELKYAYLLEISKQDISRFLSNRDFVHIILRLLAMSKINVRKKKGYSRNAKIITFGAIPLGIISKKEIIYIETTNRMTHSKIASFNEFAPLGIELLNVKKVVSIPKIRSIKYDYKIDGRIKSVTLKPKDGNIPSIKKYILEKHDGTVPLKHIVKKDTYVTF